MNYHKGFIAPLLIILAVLALGGGAYVYQQTKTQGQKNDSLQAVRDSLVVQSVQGGVVMLGVIGNSEQSCARHEYKIDFGDGTNEYLDIAKGTCAKKEATFSHLYQAAGTFTARLHDLTGIGYYEPAFDQVENPVATTTVRVNSIAQSPDVTFNLLSKPTFTLSFGQSATDGPNGLRITLISLKDDLLNAVVTYGTGQTIPVVVGTRWEGKPFVSSGKSNCTGADEYSSTKGTNISFVSISGQNVVLKASECPIDRG